MIEAVKAWSGFVLVLIFFSIILATLFIWVGTKSVVKEDIGFKKTILVAITATLVIYSVIIILSALPFIGTVPCYIIGLALSLLAIKLILSLSFQQSLIIWVFNIAAQILAVIIGAKLFIGGLGDLLKIV